MFCAHGWNDFFSAAMFAFVISPELELWSHLLLFFLSENRIAHLFQCLLLFRAVFLLFVWLDFLKLEALLFRRRSGERQVPATVLAVAAISLVILG